MIDHKAKLREYAFAFIGQQCIVPPSEGRAKDMATLRKNLELPEDKMLFFWGNHYKNHGLAELKELRKFQPKEILAFHAGEKAFTVEGKPADELYPIYFVVETELVNRRTESN